MDVKKNVFYEKNDVMRNPDNRNLEASLLCLRAVDFEGYSHLPHF